jgi:hypothetical protein
VTVSVSDEAHLVAELHAAAQALVGRRITRVTYYGLSSDAPVDWDYDTWHCPVMGVELVLDDGTPYSAVWDNAFGNFSLQLSASPMSAHLALSAEAGDCPRWTVHDHRRWAPLLASPVVESDLIWIPGLTDSGKTAPAALHLGFSAGDAWIIAAMESDGSWWLGADEVVVAFTREMAAVSMRSAGLSATPRRR